MHPTQWHIISSLTTFITLDEEEDDDDEDDDDEEDEAHGRHGSLLTIAGLTTTHSRRDLSSAFLSSGILFESPRLSFSSFAVADA